MDLIQACVPSEAFPDRCGDASLSAILAGHGPCTVHKAADLPVLTLSHETFSI